MIFDLYLDPNEKNNLVHDGKYKEICFELSQKLYNWMKETDDPLLTETPIEIPEDANIDGRFDKKSHR